MIPYKVGIGYDIHKLVQDRDLIIGGIKIPFDKGLLGHSDADVLIHAIIDAILGALSLSDIGTLFPDTDDKYKNIDSTILLKNVAELVDKKGYLIGNIDANIIAQAPKMMPYIPQIKKNISDILNIDISSVSVKAKTNEELDSVGQKLAIEANSVVLLYKK